MGEREGRHSPATGLVESGAFAWTVVVAANGVAGLAALLFALRRFYHDDAYIAPRYARNLLEGRGLVWNAGEFVEGYTSLLWVLATAALGVLGVDLETASRLLGVSALLGLLLLLVRVEARAGLACASVLAATGPLVAWSLGGLETLGFALLITAGLLGAERISDGGPARGRPFLVGLLLGVAELCRPEAVLFALPVGTWLLLRATRSRSPRELLAFLAGFGPIVLGRLAWRFAYYGDWLPNTFYAKVPSGPADLAQGAWYVLSFLLFFPGFLLLGAWAARPSARRSPTRGERLSWIAVLLYVTFVCWVGGITCSGFASSFPCCPSRC